METLPIQIEPITIHLDEPQPDPSGSSAIAEAVRVEPEFFRVDKTSKRTRLTFNLAGDKGSKITGFRYLDTSEFHGGANEWLVPNGWAQTPWRQGTHFANMEIAPGGRSMSVDVLRGNQTLYLYVLEWQDAEGVKHVCDPKVRNEG